MEGRVAWSEICLSQTSYVSYSLHALIRSGSCATRHPEKRVAQTSARPHC